MGISTGTELYPWPTQDLAVGYGYYPWIKKFGHTLSIRVRYPRVPVPMGKIAILTRKRQTYGSETL